MTDKNDKDWWRGAVLYQIYPRSYKDTNGDGIGDLPGITENLDYIASLGVDGIWISPFFKSPMKDFGYDVSDYRDVDPIFGVNEDFDILLHNAHQRGIKIIIDMVLSHTSDKHPWFIESRAAKDNQKKDWYVWADPKPDGTPPNNWQSVFGGPAWTFDTRRGQYYLHNFLPEQPDLNFHHKDVQKAMLGNMRFWLNRGVDGFRLDVANFYFHDKELRDNPPRGESKLGLMNQFEGVTPLNMQIHVYNKTRPENIAFMEKVRELMDSFGATMTVAEIGDEEALKVSAEYTQGETRLNTSYNTQIMSGTDKPLTADIVRGPLENYMQYKDGGPPAWAFSNHDVVRSVTRWGRSNGYETKPEFAKMLLALLCSLRGTVFIYQGEELGLPEGEVPFEKIQDPWGKALWPEWQGRDGCRTPMPWDDTKKHAGFSESDEEPWLPIPHSHLGLSVKRQEVDASSVLTFCRELLEWRPSQPLLKTGDISFIDHESDKVLLFERSNGTEKIFCAFNLGDTAQTVPMPEKQTAVEKPFAAAKDIYGENKGESVTLPPFGFFYSSSS